MNKYLNSFKETLKKVRFPKNLNRFSRTQLIVGGVALLLALALFGVSRGVFRCWSITRLPGSAPASCAGGGTDVIGTPLVNEQGTPVSLPPTPIVAPESLLPPAWDGASRVNILFIGLDYRDYILNEGPPRSDTMILFTVDPQSKTAGMLSIPRDLWVNIPGFGYSRINTAYASGEGNRLPGGGPALASKTVEQFLGVTIDYYAQIDFNAFVEFIDLIGGIEVYNDEDLRL